MIDTVKVTISGSDYYGEVKNIGISNIAFKSSSINTNNVFVLENTFLKRGGPPKHLHYDQDEWFYCLEGTFLFEIGNEKYKLETGDSILGPKKIPHVWAHIGNNIGRIIVAFAPAGKMELFFKDSAKRKMLPMNDKEFYQLHGMELLGPPIDTDNI